MKKRDLVGNPAWPFICVITVLIFGFQNCGKVEFNRLDSSNTKLTSESSTSASHNGDGYHGKVTYLKFDNNGICNSSPNAMPLERVVEKAIEYFDGQYNLVINDCRPIIPRAISPADIHSSPDDLSIVVFNNEIFLDESLALSQPETHIVAYCFARDVPYYEILDVDIILSENTITQELQMSYLLTASDIFSGALIETRQRQDAPATHRVISGASTAADDYIIMQEADPALEEFKITVNASGSVYPDPETFTSSSLTGGRDYSSSAMTCVWD